MSYDGHDLLESVIHITNERDKGSLIQVLVNVLSDLIDFDALVLLRLPPESNHEYLEVAASVPTNAYQDIYQVTSHEYGIQRVSTDNSASLCIQHREIISDKKGNTGRTIFPLIVNDMVTGILDIYGYQHTPYTTKIIHSFVRIYSNFVAIMDDNEHDTLTGLLNRKTFDAQISTLFSKKINPAPFEDKERRNIKHDAHHWVGILDIDHFKSINDNYGHIYGDEVLLLFAELMRKSYRSNDLLFRYGGEEFVVVLRSTTESDAFTVFERFRQKLESVDFPQVGKVTASIGIVKIDSQKYPTTILEHADQALYYAKEHGRNRACNYHELVAAGLLEARHIKDDIEIF